MATIKSYSDLQQSKKLAEIPQDCKGNSEDVICNRRKYMTVKSMVRDLIEYL